MQVGDLVRIKASGTMWDNKTAKIEDIWEKNDQEYATCYVDFIPEEGKRIRQDFSLNVLEPLTNECYNIRESLREDMGKIIKEVDWNGHHYTFENTFRSTGTKNHDVLTMTDEDGNSWTGETTWINRPWHRFDLEEAFSEIVSKAFGPKALELVYEINKSAHSVEDAIDTFFDKFNANDISSNETTKYDDSEDARRQALADYLEIGVDEVESKGDNYFKVNDEEYRVLTNDEADYEFDNNVRNLWDDLGLEGVGSYLKEWILENALDESALEDVVRDEIQYDVYDYLSDDEVAEECIDYDIISREEAYDEEDNVRDDLDFDDLREQLMNKRLEDIGSYGEYLIDRGWDEESLSQYLDEDQVIEAIKDDIDVNGSGRGQELAWYDGNELDLGNDLYAYRVD